MADVLQDLSKIVMFTAGLLTVETDWGAVHIDSRDATIGPDPTVDQSIYNKVKFTRTSMMLNTGVFDQKFTIPFLLMTCDEKIDITIKHGRDKSRHEDNLGQATALFGQNSYTSSYNPRDIIENPKSFRDCKVDGETFSAHLHRER
ncbi:hypothetical protein FRC04_008943 [Tulasnella sp. 424]|nr:hypothetical protein FRC04_008943 [Tulasnella sp. 424]